MAPSLDAIARFMLQLARVGKTQLLCAYLRRGLVSRRLAAHPKLGVDLRQLAAFPPQFYDVTARFFR